MNKWFEKNIILLNIFLVLSLTMKAQEDKIGPSMVMNGEFLGESIPLRDLPSLTEEEMAVIAEKGKNKILNPTMKNRSYPYASTAHPKGPDPVWQNFMGDSRDTRAPIQTFEGAFVSNLAPTDPNGTIGPEHYMQTINTVYTIYNRAGYVVAGPTSINTLFYGLAGSSYNDGDPIVLYDDQADRWLIAEFSISGTNDYLLVAVSTTNDPTGTWYKYSFDVWDVPDYPKFGIWQDGYYLGTNTYDFPDIYVLERSRMLQGLSPQGLGFDNPWRPGPSNAFNCVPPLDNDGSFAPAGEPGMFIAFNDDAVGGGSDELWIYELDVDWDTLLNSSFSRTQQLAVSSFDSNFGTTQANLSQQGTTQKLDAIPMVIMNPPQYRNFGSYETIVCCHTVDVDNTNHAGIRWYELRRISGGDWTIRQEGTYAPDSHSRWMGSIVLNGSNEIGLGYSITGSTLYPGIRYCGQSSAAYATGNGVLDVAEQVIHAGTQSQLYTYRWGDYSSMQVDVLDDETFWYTTQYVTGSSFPQTLRTKIANFQIGTEILTANFGASQINPQTFSSVTLSDASFGDPIGWNWTITPSTCNFLSGTSDTSQNPQIQFTASGNYSVSLIITNGTVYDTISKLNYIDVIDCGYLYLPFQEDFSDTILPTCWKNVDNRGFGEVWAFGISPNWIINTTTGSNGVAILDSYYYTSGYTQNADLITPLLDLSDYVTVNLFFEHFFPYYTPNPTSAYGRLYYSIDGGASWTLQQSWNNSGNGDDVSINMTTQLAGKSRVRLKWNYTGYGYFWAIDDISITGTGPNTWTGATSSSWAAASNWSTGTVPTSSSKVIIPDTAPNWPAFTGDFSLGNQCDKLSLYGDAHLSVAGDFILASGKTLEFKGPGIISLSGDWNHTGGNLISGNGTITFTGSSPAYITAPVSNNITDVQRMEFTKGMTALTGATAGPSGLNGSANVPIGFTFSYLGTTYTQANICTNGWLSLNLSGASSNDNTTVFSTTAPQTTLAPWFDYLNVDASAALSYKTEGTAPNRIFTVEWKNVLTYRNQATARINFQVKLFESTNIVEFHYGNLTAGSHNNSESASIGIEDATGGPGHFIEATTGSTTTGITNLNSTTQWPLVNYRFTPPLPSGSQTLPSVRVEKSGSILTVGTDLYLNGTLELINGTMSLPETSSKFISIDGNWSNSGTFLPGVGEVIFNGKSNQTISGDSVSSFSRFTLNNPTSITLQKKVRISDTLNMLAGNIVNPSDTLELGTSATVTGFLNWSLGNITGPFKRWIAASTASPIDFPVGTDTSHHNARITFSNNTGGTITVSFEPGDPGNNTGFPLSEDSETISESDLYTDGSWKIIASGLSSSDYSLELTGAGFSSEGPVDESTRILKRPHTGGDWTLDGIHVAASPPIAKRSGLNGFSQFALAKPGQGNKISGNLKYYNVANTPLNSGFVVKLYQDDAQVGSDYTVTNGTYEFTGLTPGIYELRVSSTLSTAGSVNTTDAAQVNYWGAMPYTIEKVRFYAGDVTGSSFFINGTDALRIQDHFVNETALDKGNWAFWKTGETISSNSNPSASYPTVNLVSGTVTANIYGLCAGDFNRSFIPGARTSASGNVSLINNGNILAGSNQICHLPIRLTDDLDIGAISLIINFPNDLMEVLAVEMDSDINPVWSAKDGELRISWTSLYPLQLYKDDVLLSLILKTNPLFKEGDIIQIGLVKDQLNELANGNYNVIPEAILCTDLVAFSTTGTLDKEHEIQNALHMECHPNPFSDNTTFVYSLPADGQVTLDITDMAGGSKIRLLDQKQQRGFYRYRVDVAMLKPGIYAAELILTSSREVHAKTIKLVRAW